MRRVLALALAAGVLAGCSGATEAPENVERLTIAIHEDRGPVNLFAGVSEPLAELVYDKLVAPSPYVADPVPWLATAVRPIDATTWEADLRSDVTWHDGTPFGVDDVVFTFRYMREAPTGRWTHHVADIPTVTAAAVDADTVRFTCAFACPELGDVTLADLPIIPEHIWSTVPPQDAKKVTTLPVGTGPYRLVAYAPGNGYRFEANEGYFAGRPQVAALEIPVIEDPSTTFTALRTGEIDATFRPLAPELVDQFGGGSGGIEVIRTAPYQFPEMRINYEHSPYDVPEVRRAISRAVDKQQLATVVGLGKARPALQGYPHPDSPHTAPGLSTPFDATEAAALLEAAGVRDTDGDGVREAGSTPLRPAILVNGAFPTDVRAAELVAEDLGKVGIAATVEGVDAGTLTARNSKRDFDLQIGTITAHGVADPDQFIMSHRSGYLWKAPTIPYPEFDALFEQWRAASTNEARRDVSFQMQQLFNRQPTSVPLYYPDEYYAVRADRYAGWMESPGFGVVHKWSLLPEQVSRDAHAVVVAR
ncbi:MAG: ABC transporter substrate-binding protein [Pseudonocardia sp.]